MIDIESIKMLCTDESIIMTNHVMERIRERGIKYQEIKDAILNGQIIERYENDYPYPSCLILGYTINRTVLHVVAGSNGTELWIITAYYPSPDKWESDFKTRKAV